MKAIFFDLDGTLLHLTQEYREVLTDTFSAVLGESREEWIELYNQAFYDSFKAHEPNPYLDGFSAVNTQADPERLIETLRNREIAMCQPPENAHSDLDRLAESFKLGILTNGLPDWQMQKLRAYDLEQYFDVFVASYDVGMHKPHVSPFHTAEKRLPADSYAMIGDSDADIDGATDAGWTTHRYQGDGFVRLPDTLDW